MLTLTHQLPALFLNPFSYLLPTGTAGQQTDRCKQHPAADMPLCPLPAREASLVMDIRGCIVDCNLDASELLGQTAESLAGQSIGAFLPDLPFSPQTPGKNLAYVGLNLAIDRWKPHTALTPIGIPIAVEITLHILKRRGKCFIALGLRQPLAGETFKLNRDSI